MHTRGSSAAPQHTAAAPTRWSHHLPLGVRVKQEEAIPWTAKKTILSRGAQPQSVVQAAASWAGARAPYCLFPLFVYFPAPACLGVSCCCDCDAPGRIC
jgi:hypothetical protein